VKTGIQLSLNLAADYKKLNPIEFDGISGVVTKSKVLEFADFKGPTDHYEILALYRSYSLLPDIKPGRDKTQIAFV
jgi:peptidoglycan hydrolase-like protein with peptidoglycan-binding domain